MGKVVQVILVDDLRGLDVMDIEHIVPQTSLDIHETPFYIGQIDFLSCIEIVQAQVIGPEVEHTHVCPPERNRRIYSRDFRKVI